MKMDDEEIKKIIDEMFDVKPMASAPGGGAVDTYFYNKSMKNLPSFQTNVEIGKKEDAIGKMGGGTFRPFPLENIHENIVDSFMAMSAVEKQVKTCLDTNASVTEKKPKKEGLMNVLKNIKLIKEAIKNISGDLDEIFLVKGDNLNI